LRRVPGVRGGPRPPAPYMHPSRMRNEPINHDAEFTLTYDLEGIEKGQMVSR